MKTEHYPSLDLCKKLTEIGFPETENSHFEFIDDGTWEGIYARIPGRNRREHNEYVCPSVMEMLDVMPKSFVYEHNFFKRAYELEVRWNNYASKYMVEYYCFVNRECLVNYTNILPNALAEMILWLHENKYITFIK